MMNPIMDKLIRFEGLIKDALNVTIDAGSCIRINFSEKTIHIMDSEFSNNQIKDFLKDTYRITKLPAENDLPVVTSISPDVRVNITNSFDRYQVRIVNISGSKDPSYGWWETYTRQQLEEIDVATLNDIIRKILIRNRLVDEESAATNKYIQTILIHAAKQFYPAIFRIESEQEVSNSRHFLISAIITLQDDAAIISPDEVLSFSA